MAKLKSTPGIIHLDEAGALFKREFGGEDSEHDRDKAGRFKGKKRKPAKKGNGNG